MDDIEEDDNAEQFNCELSEDNENENEIVDNVEKPNEPINEKIDDALKKDIEESWIIIIKKYLDEINEGSDELARQLNQICKDFNFYENSKRLDLIKQIIKDAYNHSRINFEQRLIDFSKFLLSEKNLNYDIIHQAVNNADKETIQNSNKDIIYFWKEYIVRKYCIFLTENISDLSKKIIKSLLEENYNLAEIFNILHPFRFFLGNKNFSQIEIMESLISIIIAYKINQIDGEFIKIINDNTIKNEAKGTIELNSKVALEFYLVATRNSKKVPDELSPSQLLTSLKNMNPEITDDIIKQRENQLDNIKIIIENNKIIGRENFQKWAKSEFPKLNFEKNFNESTSKVLAMISLAIKEIKGYYLRNAQLLAILMFIGKNKKYGLIEEISTGEGKSCIICSLSIYYALRKKKVDIISSSYSLAIRDSNEFSPIYGYFNLTTSYPKNSDPYPYKCDILYGTFLEFEGDCLRELVSDKKIRNNRPYEVIIVDEVDNLFIDNILSSTRLTGSTKGFKFLIPLYLAVYLSFELYDFIFLFFFSFHLKNIDPEKRKKYERLIKEPEYRKKIITNFTKTLFSGLNNNKPEFIDDLKYIDEEKIEKIEDEVEKKSQKVFGDIQNFMEKLERYLKFPDFLEPFVNFQMKYWLNNAFKAKNYMNINIDYVITEGRNKDIAPVDRENTGETELSTVYSDGLHQMLEIKEKLRIKDETLTDTFLSHITYFQNYKNQNEFLFFGLTGTIGDTETQKIYQKDYFNSKLLFIPQYKKKRFIELPPILSNILEHEDNICEDIIINYSYGRKVLVICESIKEAQNLNKKLLKFDVEALKEKNPNIKEDYKSFILLYTRSDTSEKENYKNERGKIVLSTNIGGRGTDIKTTDKEEENGGMHVILTTMSSNYRVLKQAFGRTSREGKKGTGQLIIKKEAYESYSEIVNEMIINEKERIEDIQRHLKILLFKDKLFIDFCGIIKGLDKDSCLFDDIRERWAMFLKKNISLYSKNDLNVSEIEKEFKKFKEEIEETVNMEIDHEKYKNPFIKIHAGLKKYKTFDKGLINYLDIEMKNKKFVFVIPYLKAVILINEYRKKKYDEKFYEIVKEYLNETNKSITLIIENSIDPVLNSFSQWNEVFSNLKLEINDNLDNELYEADEEVVNDIRTKSFKKEDLYKQYENIKNILKKIQTKINSNIDFIETYRIRYGNNNSYFIYTVKKDLEDELNESEMREINFFYDASFYYVFDFMPRLKIVESFFMKFLKFLVAIIFIPLSLAIAAIGLAIAGVSLVGFLAFYSVNALYDKIRINRRGNLDIENNSLFSNILFAVVQKFRYENELQQKALNLENEKEEDYMIYKSLVKSLKSDIYEIIEKEFIIIEKLNIVKFLYFIDIYLSNEFWSKKISQIIEINFKNIFETEFNKNKNLYNRKITKNNYEALKTNFQSIFSKFWTQCLKDMINMEKKKEYNEETGINSLEHLIRRYNPNEITDEIIDNTFKQILKNKIILENGYANEKLFKDCFTLVINGKILTLEQQYPINITTKINEEDLKKSKEISNLKDFVVKGIKVPIVSSYCLDLIKFYKRHGYNVEEQKNKDFSLFIINNIKNIIQKMLIVNDKVCKVFYQRLLNNLKLHVKKVMDEKIFVQSNFKNVEKEISLILDPKEKSEFEELIKKAEEDIKKIENKKKDKK